MNGDTAQWYARSRYTTSDFDRMRRQRELQQAILAQANPANVLTRFQQVAAAGEDLVQTDIPSGMLPFLMDLAVKAKEQPVQTLELTPEGAGIDTDEPTAEEYAHVRELVQQGRQRGTVVGRGVGIAAARDPAGQQRAVEGDAIATRATTSWST